MEEWTKEQDNSSAFGEASAHFHPRKIVKWPSDVLKAVAADVDGTPDKELILGMFATMYSHYGVGLAAPQIAISEKIFVFDDSEGFAGVVVNPKIREMGRIDNSGAEGCLSIPGTNMKINRADWLVVDHLDQFGNEKTTRVEGYQARIWQHEIEHLFGICIGDYLNRAQRREIMGANKTLKRHKR